MRPDIGQKFMLCSVGDARQHFLTGRCGENLQFFHVCHVLLVVPSRYCDIGLGG